MCKGVCVRYDSHAQTADTSSSYAHQARGAVARPDMLAHAAIPNLCSHHVLRTNMMSWYRAAQGALQWWCGGYGHVPVPLPQGESHDLLIIAIEHQDRS